MLNESAHPGTERQRRGGRLAPEGLKRAMDLCVAVPLLVLTLPLCLLIAVAVRSTSRGGALFRQTRVGLGGRRFTMLKFRTMVEEAEIARDTVRHLNRMSAPEFKVPGDPRVTRVGRWLRRFSLDELPQLWNVVRGDMSLVGPRPALPESVERYLPWQRRRLAVRPGMTCLWQVSGRSELDFDTWVRLDLEYVDSWSPWLDLKILCRTVPAVLSGRGAV